MFCVEEFKNSSTWDLKNKIFYQYCDWCFSNNLDDNGDDCEICQQQFHDEITKREQSEGVK